MEFNFDVSAALRSVAASVQQGDIYVVRGDQLKGSNQPMMEQVKQIVDAMGHASGKAQKLPSTITTHGKLQANGHILFMKAQANKAIGFLKVGYKQLFVRGRGGEMHEMKPLAVLDFYVDAQVQRGGYGKALFDTMLAYMQSQPALIAYDRPSHKLMGFLAKHFKLSSYVQQNNNYVVFDDYFTATNVSQPADSEGKKPIVRQSTQNAPREGEQTPASSVFGQSHMSSFQHQGSASNHQPGGGSSQMQTMNGGWSGSGASRGPDAQTYYPRASHHNQTFRIGGEGQPGGSGMQKRTNESTGGGTINQAYIRTYANTFAASSSAIPSQQSGTSSQHFEQTQSSNGFGSTFLSQAPGHHQNFRQQQQQLHQQSQPKDARLGTRYVDGMKTSTTQMKFGNVGQELLNGTGPSADNHLHDFKQSFTKLNFQRQQEQQQYAQPVSSNQSSAFQTSYQSQYQKEGNSQAVRQQQENVTSSRGATGGLFGTQQPQAGYSHFMAFANRQQSLPVSQQQATSGSAHYQMQSRHSDHHPFQKQQPYGSTFQGNQGGAALQQQLPVQDYYKSFGASGVTGGNNILSPTSSYHGSKASSMPARSLQAHTALGPATHRLLQQNIGQNYRQSPSITNTKITADSSSVGHSISGRIPAHSAKIMNTQQRTVGHLHQHANAILSPVGGSKAAQFLQHQHLFQGGAPSLAQSSATLQRPLATSPQQQFTQIWQSQDQLSGSSPLKATTAMHQFRNY